MLISAAGETVALVFVSLRWGFQGNRVGLVVRSLGVLGGRGSRSVITMTVRLRFLAVLMVGSGILSICVMSGRLIRSHRKRIRSGPGTVAGW